MSRNKALANALPPYLDLAEMHLKRGERVPVRFSDSLHKAYIGLKLRGFYPGLLCVKENKRFYLCRVR